MTNVCMICESRAEPYFTKQYAETKFSESLSVEYCKCSECGFVYSRTHQEMPKSNWEALNLRCHQSFESDLSSRTINQPPYAGMAMAVNILSKNGIIHVDRTLDYAAGYGSLSKILSKYHGINIDCYDKYVFDDSSSDHVHYVSGKSLGDYNVVVNSAMFEHVVARQDLDEVNDCVAAAGVLMLHTLVCENVPADPEWFYLDPIVHCAFHTNKSMRILMNQWEYSDSVYAPIAKSWFLFKNENPLTEDLAGIVERVNNQFQSDIFHHKKGFVDFWKGF